MFYFCCLGRGAGPAQTAKKNTPPPKQQKDKHAPAPSERVFFLAVWAGGRVYFVVWTGDEAVVFVFFAVSWRGGGGGVVLLFGRWRVLFFAFWAEGVFFLLFGRGACFIFAVWAGDQSSLTYRSAWLVFKRPNNKKDQTAKKKKRIPPLPSPCPLLINTNVFINTTRGSQFSKSIILGFAMEPLRIILGSLWSLRKLIQPMHKQIHTITI